MGAENPFQVSWAEYQGRKSFPRVTVESLEQFAMDFDRKNEFGKVVESAGGECRFGKYGTAVFRSPRHARIQVWVVSDGRDHILATYICDDEPPAGDPRVVHSVYRHM